MDFLSSRSFTSDHVFAIWSLSEEQWSLPVPRLSGSVSLSSRQWSPEIRRNKGERALLSETEVIDSFLKDCLEPMHAAEQISEITPRSFGYDRKHPVVMYYFAAGVLCGNIFRERSCNTLPTVNRLPNNVRALSYKINPIKLPSLLRLACRWLSRLSLFLCESMIWYLASGLFMGSSHHSFHNQTFI